MPGSREAEAFVAQSVSRRRKRSFHLFLEDQPKYDPSVETFCSHPPRSITPHAMDLLFNTGVIMVRRDASRADSTCAFKSQGWEEGKVGSEGVREGGREGNRNGNSLGFAVLRECGMNGAVCLSLYVCVRGGQ